MKGMCIFCGVKLTGSNKSKEHVIPQWLLDLYKARKLGAKEVIVTPTFHGQHLVTQSDIPLKPDKFTFHEEITRDYNLASIQLGDICKICNNGWMSQLEVNVAPFLIDLIEGRRVIASLTNLERQFLAQWTMKTCMTLHFSSSWRRVVPIKHPKQFCQHAFAIPDHISIFATQSVESSDMWDNLQTTTWSYVSPSPFFKQTRAYSQEVDEKAYKICFRIFHLTLGVAHWPFPDWEIHPVLGLHEPLWPDAETFTWHIMSEISDAGLTGFLYQLFLFPTPTKQKKQSS